jgi:transcription initiation factor TFIIB
MQTSIMSCMCNSGRQVTDLESGEIVCTSCGWVAKDKAVETRGEWRTFENNDSSRVGSPGSLAFHDMGLATIIGKANKDSTGRSLNSSMKSAMARLRTWDARTRVYSTGHRALMHAFRELDRLKDKLGLSDAIVEKTAYIYRKAQDRRLTRGRTVASVLAAAIYIACRELGAQRTLRDVCNSVDVKRKDLARSYRLLILELDIKVPLVDPLKCITKIANKANLSAKITRTAISRMKELVQKEISAGKDPMALAATVLYETCLTNHEKLTQKDIADAAGVTEVTIRNRLKDIRTRFPDRQA